MGQTSTTTNKIMKLIVQIKNIYGVNRIYPVCEKSKTFSRIAGLKTLQQSTIDEIIKLGYKIYTEGRVEIRGSVYNGSKI